MGHSHDSNESQSAESTPSEGVLTQSRRGMMKLAGGGLGAMAVGGTLVGSATAETADGNCVQVDFVTGTTELSDLSSSTYSDDGRLIKAQWGETVDNETEGETTTRTPSSTFCDITVDSGPTIDFSAETATVNYSLSNCGGAQDLLLVSYESPCNGAAASGGTWDPTNAGQQTVFDTDKVTTQTDGSLTVDVPPLPAGVPQRGNAVGYVPLDGSSLPAKNCITAADVTVPSDKGTPSPGGTGVSSNTNDAFSFDLSTDDTLGTDSLPINDTQATVGAWFRFSSRDDFTRPYEARDGIQTDGAWLVIFNGANDDIGLVVPGQSNITTYSSSELISLSPDKWYFIVTVLEDFDNSRLTVYDESGLVDSVDYSGTRTDNRSGSTSKPLDMMGTVTEGRSITGRMDEVFVYSTALTPSEVDTLYNNSF